MLPADPPVNIGLYASVRPGGYDGEPLAAAPHLPDGHQAEDEGKQRRDQPGQQEDEPAEELPDPAQQGGYGQAVVLRARVDRTDPGEPRIGLREYARLRGPEPGRHWRERARLRRRERARLRRRERARLRRRE